MPTISELTVKARRLADADKSNQLAEIVVQLCEIVGKLVSSAKESSREKRLADRQ